MAGTQNTEKLRIAFWTNTSFSGSTLLSFLLDAHPQIVSGSGLNPGVLKRNRDSYRCTCGELLKECPFWTSIFAKVQAQGFDFSIDNCNLRYSFSDPVWDRILGRYYVDPIRRSIRLLAERYSTRYRAHQRHTSALNVAYMRAVLDTSGALVCLHNTKPLLVLRNLLDHPDLDARVISMVRDVRGYVNSAMKRGITLDHAARRWRDRQESVAHEVRRLPNERAYVLHYEDLCRDPHSTLQSLYAFLGVEVLEPPDTIVTRQHHITGNKMRLKEQITVKLDEKWTSELSPAQISRILQIAGETNQKMGYSP